MANARTAAVRLLLHIAQENAYVNLLLHARLGTLGMDARDQALCSALVYGVLERRITLDYVIASHTPKKLSEIDPLPLECLRVGAYQLLFMDRVPPSAAINESVRTVKFLGGARSAGFVNAVLHAIDRDGKKIALPPEKNWRTYLSVKYSCPQWIVRLWRSAYGADCAEALLAAMLGRPPLTVRVNTTRISAEACVQRLAECGVTAESCTIPDALALTRTGPVEQLAPYAAGLFHVQDLASQICVGLLDPQPGMRVADVCAAPGGKSFTMAERMQNCGRIDAFDLYPQRASLIADGAARLGLTCIHAGVRDAQTGAVDAQCDRVLCDVPCSGLGVLRRKPEIRYKSKEMLDNLPDLQYSILAHTAQMVAPGGRLLYSTCTLNPAENDAVAARFAQEHPEFAPEPLDGALPHYGPEPSHQITLMPQIHGTDGFFAARFRRCD